MSSGGIVLRRLLAVGAVLMCLPPVAGAQSLSSALRCEQLAALALPGGTVRSTRLVAAGANRPAHCRVAATLTPSNDSAIEVEVWMPTTGWNGKFQAVGNGAFNGNINTEAMAAALERGYATASTDTGHSGGGAAWALGHPEKVIDFGWRAVHEMTVAAKRLIAAHYARAPTRSYWNGCSAGGRQGLMAAQRFPDDFDGVIAGAPALDWTGRAAQAARLAQRLETNERAQLKDADRQLLGRAALHACDAADGVVDGLVANPPACRVDPGTLTCGGAPGAAACLSPAQVETARLMYSSGLLPGSEPGWTDLGWTASARATGLDQFRYLVYGDPDWTLQQFEFERDLARARQVDNGTLDAGNPDLRPFFARGGRLIHYHGWADPQISPLDSTTYYERVVALAGGRSRVHDSYRLFMAPGMGHCRGGNGPNTFDALAALEKWVEQGEAPDALTASQAAGPAGPRTRPLCPFPQLATYDGRGNPNDAASFTCSP